MSKETYTDHLAAVDARLATIDEHLRSIDGHLGRLNGQATQHNGRLDSHEVKLAIVETQFASTLKWRDRLGGAAVAGTLSLGLFVLEKLL